MPLSSTQARSAIAWIGQTTASLNRRLAAAPNGPTAPALQAQLDLLGRFPSTAADWVAHEDELADELSQLAYYQEPARLPLAMQLAIADAQLLSEGSLLWTATPAGQAQSPAPSGPLDPSAFKPIHQLTPEGAPPGFRGNNYCGPASAAMALTYLGHPLAENRTPYELVEELARRFRTDTNPANQRTGGTAPVNLLPAFEALGLSAEQIPLKRHILRDSVRLRALTPELRQEAYRAALGEARYARLFPYLGRSYSAERALPALLASDPAMLDDMWRWALPYISARPGSAALIDGEPTTEQKLRALAGTAFTGSNLAALGARVAAEDFIQGHVEAGHPVMMNLSRGVLHPGAGGGGHYVLCVGVERDAQERPVRWTMIDPWPPTGKPQTFVVTADRLWLAMVGNSECSPTAIFPPAPAPAPVPPVP